MLKYVTALALLAALVYACAPEVINKYEPVVLRIDPEKAADQAARIRKASNVELSDGLTLDLWAADSLVQDPIAISVAHARVPGAENGQDRDPGNPDGGYCRGRDVAE